MVMQYIIFIFKGKCHGLNLLAADGEGNGWDKKHPAISKYFLS
jgi:hypothetical protein